ncbi:MAG: hypothetical protein ACRD1B_12370 [Thermoanaerobaculia bacterium]
MTDDSVKIGTLARCTATLCVLSGTEIPRSTIRYIGLGAKLPPPPPRDPSRDEVHRIDKSIHPGPLLSVDADTVATASTTHPRKSVAWIYLTPADLPSPGPQPPSGARTYEYDVTLRAVMKNEGVTQARYRSNLSTRNWTRETTWTSTFRNVRVTVTASGASFFGSNMWDGTSSTAPAHAIARVTETWKLFWHEHADGPVDVSCEGEMTRDYPMSLQASAWHTSDPNLEVNFMGLGDWGFTSSEVISPDCKGIMPPPFVEPRFTRNGLSVSASHTTLAVNFGRRTGGLASPVSEFVTGRAFELTGRHRTEDPSCDPQRGDDARDAGNECTRSFQTEQRYDVTFTPRR